MQTHHETSRKKKSFCLFAARQFKKKNNNNNRLCPAVVYVFKTAASQAKLEQKKKRRIFTFTTEQNCVLVLKMIYSQASWIFCFCNVPLQNLKTTAIMYFFMFILYRSIKKPKAKPKSLSLPAAAFRRLSPHRSVAQAKTCKILISGRF